jgi:hypothetical protein
MATTTNYGWTTPDDTDLVKDGAAAIRTLGSSVDTTTKALNPETTTGDIAYRSATADTNTRLALGTAGQVLTVNSGATAPEWATAITGGGFFELGSGSLASGGTTLSTINQGYKDLILVLRDFFPSSGPSGVRIRFNGVTASSYIVSGVSNTAAATSATNPGIFLDDIDQGPQTSTQDSHAVMRIFDYADTSCHIIAHTVFQYKRSGGANSIVNQVASLLNSDNVDEINIAANAGNLSGSYVLYGVK